MEKIAMKALKKFERIMDDNMDTGKALKVMEELSDSVGKTKPDRKSGEKILETFRTFDSILGLRHFCLTY